MSSFRSGDPPLEDRDRGRRPAGGSELVGSELPEAAVLITGGPSPPLDFV